MATAGQNSETGPGNKAVPGDSGVRDHDRVAMLSLKADGTPDQNAPEFIMDEERTLEATRQQFVEQAISVTDDARRRELATGAGEGALRTDEDGNTEVVPADKLEEDPTVKALTEAHDKVEKQATSAAESAVKALTPDSKRKQ